MSKNTGFSTGVSLIIKRALEGRISPLNFLIILGFLCSLVLLYISLHVYFFSMSQDLSECRERLEILRDNNVRLTAIYNDLISPDRIIGKVQELGMRAGSPDEIKRLALYEGLERNGSESAGWADAGATVSKNVKSGVESEGR